ncbi:hypothetical protein [Pontibacter ruber]|uniref:STAS/SEC14 domain-containing protein n=1 Tax=Pontibacter ruber TaxID=1343895 RepID=A0ABW5D0L4_9BACT|nr:hypothetical protein [Pontibacter ruber]
MLKLYYETEAIRVSYDKDLQLGLGEWKGFVSSDELRVTAMRSLDFINQYSIIHWLSDRSKMKAIRQQDQQWIVEAFIPKLLESPLRRMASVVSEDMFNKMALNNILQRSGGLGDIVFCDFDNLDNAIEWLKLPLSPEPSAESGDASVLGQEQ